MSILSEIVELEKKYQKLLGKYRKVSKSEIPTDVLDEAKVLNKKIHQLMKENGVSQEDVIKAYKEDAKKVTESKAEKPIETVIEVEQVASPKVKKAEDSNIEENTAEKIVTSNLETEENITKATKTKSTTKKATKTELATIETEIEKPKTKRATKTKKTVEPEIVSNVELAETEITEKPKAKRTTKTKKTVEPEIISNIELTKTEEVVEKPKAKRTSKAKTTAEAEKVSNINIISDENESEKTVKKATKKSSSTAKATTTRKKATKKQLQDEENDVKINILNAETVEEPTINNVEVAEETETEFFEEVVEDKNSNVQKIESDIETKKSNEIEIDIEKLEEEVFQETENNVSSTSQAALNVKQMMEEAEKKVQAEKIAKANEEMKKALEKAKAEIVRAEQDGGEVQAIENISKAEKSEIEESKKALPVVIKKKGIFAKIFNLIAKIKFIRINKAISKAALQYSDLSGLEKYVYVTTGSLDKFLKEINKGNKQAVEALGEIFFNEIDNNIEDGIRTDFLTREEKYESRLNDKKGKRAAKNIEEKAYETFEQSFIKAIDLYDFLSPEEKAVYATRSHFDYILKGVKEEVELIDIKKMIYTFTKLKNTTSMRKSAEQE